MNKGVEHFSGSRLTEALQFLMATQSELANQAGIDRSTINRILAGTHNPSYNNFVKICDFTGFPSNYFLLPEFESDEIKTFWRSNRNQQNLFRKKGNSVLKWQSRIWKRFKEDLNLPEFQLDEIKQITRGLQASEITNTIVENVANAFRVKINNIDKPIKNLTRVIERQGVVVTQFDLKADKLDGASTLYNDVNCILLNPFKQSSARTRFDLAHELGHLLMHYDVSFEDYENKDKFDLIEGQAHYFASLLLLPETGFINDIWAPTLKCFEGVKEKWNVSIQAIMRRSLDLRLMTNTQYHNLNIAISRKGWRQNEPLDDIIPLESPYLFKKCVNEYLKENYSKDQILSHVNLPSRIAEEILGLDVNFFDEDHEEAFDNIIEFKPH